MILRSTRVGLIGTASASRGRGCCASAVMPSIKRVLLFAATALHIGVSVSSPIQPPQPVCTSCAEWCAGSCSFGGPAVNGHVNSRQLQNITVYRMTAANVTDLDFKNTGDPAGDLDFNMDERAIPLVCRHSATASSTPDCIEGNTHSWLLDSRLVYLQWVIEVDGMWGPYQMCNLNLTNPATGRAGDGKWSCRGASFDSGNFTDRELCGTCERTGRAVGWKYMNASSATKAHAPRMPSAQCNATFQRVCAGQTSFKNCTSCYSRHRRAELSPACNGSYNYMSQLCPRPPTPSAACNASAEQLCGHFRTSPAMHKNCSRCLQNHSLSLEDGPCGHDGEVHSLLLKNGFCTAPASNNWWHTKSNDTWVGPQQLHMNHGKMVRMMGGSWFSTTKDGRCDTAKGQRPGDGSGCR
jgi:hypothetical protein